MVFFKNGLFLVSVALVLFWIGFYFPSLIGLEYCLKLFEIGVYLLLGEVAVSILFLFDVIGLLWGLFIWMAVVGREPVFGLDSGLVNFLGVFFTLNTLGFYWIVIVCCCIFLIGLVKVIILFLLVDRVLFPITLLLDPIDD